ncbi:transposase [Spiroplasma endosymbiont of Nebria brevicollis]
MKVTSKAIFVALGINQDGHREILGFFVPCLHPKGCQSLKCETCIISDV